MNIKNWEVGTLNKDKAVRISEEYNLPTILAMMLQIRGMDTPDKIAEILGDELELGDPFEIKDMDAAVDRILAAMENFEKIAVYGDYDADGVTSTSILYTYLQQNGADVIYYIPKREGEGYGMNMSAVDFLKEQGVSLVVTVDNGISSVDEIAYAKKLGIDVVVTDHHRPHEKLPDAVAVVDPFRKDCESSFKNFSGAGLALKLVMALETEFGDPDDVFHEFADLASLGTVGDLVSLTGENRIIVKQGLKSLAEGGRPGIDALIKKAGCEDREITSSTLAFSLVPRINATGRMGEPEAAVKLLCSADVQEAQAIAEDICENNSQRRNVESEITDKVIERIDNDDSIKYSRVIVVEGKDWHQGVIGIVASRITDRYGKPCMIISESEDGEAKGSGRSVEGFNLFEAISYCGDILVKFGGHPMAAGVTMKSQMIPEFRRMINEYAAKNYQEMPAAKVKIDCKLMPASLNVSMPGYLKYLEPFGCDNPVPLFGLYRMRLDNITPVGGGNHLRLTFSRDNVSVTCMKFATTTEEFPYEIGSILDLAVTLESKVFRGAESLTVLIKDMKFNSEDTEELIRSLRLYEKFRREEKLTAGEAGYTIPSREDFAVLYRFLRSKNGWSKSPILLMDQLESERFNLSKLLIALDVMTERGLLKTTVSGDNILVDVCKVEGKVDLTKSPVYIKLSEMA